MSRESAINAAMDVADELAAGRLDSDDLEATAARECLELVRFVDGPGDALWDGQVEIFRQVLQIGGACTSDELTEWAAVYRLAEGGRPETSWIERTLEQLAGEDS